MFARACKAAYIFKHISDQVLTYITIDASPNLVKEYLYVILIKTFQYWSANKDSIDVREVASTMRDIQLKGIRKTIGL